MSNYKVFQNTHDVFQHELNLAKSNLGKAKKSEALNFPGFIESNEQVLNFYSKVDLSYIENIFDSNINNNEEILKESIEWLKEATSNLNRFNLFCSEARNRGDITEKKNKIAHQINQNLQELIKKIKKDFNIQEQKSKRDRCLRIADRKFDKPSAYKSGAVVRCRQGKIWKGIKEEVIREKAKETLRTWFKRKGEPGKKGGWVDCNAPIRKDGKIKGYKACGREEGEKRAKYPSCRPTPAQCKTPGKGKKWGKTK